MLSLAELRNLDWKLLGLLLLIEVFGVLGVYSASWAEGGPLLFKKHLLYLVFGWVVLLLASREKLSNFLDTSLYIYLSVLFLLVLVLIVGKEVYGSKRWLSLGFINLQPSEFMKLSLILLSAYLLPHIRGLTDRNLLLLFLVFSIPTLLTLKQPDLGTAVTYLSPLLAMLVVRGVRLRYFLLVLLLLLAFSPLLWSLLKDYQKRRILAVLDPHSDYLGSGYQLIQSVIAIGSGGLTGKGIGKSTQAQLLFLPESHTDFIFSVIGEELGFLGTFTLTSLIFLFLLRILGYMRFALTPSERLFISGVFSLLSFQYSVNILMTLGLFPVVGIPLPFVSFGGSSIITFSLAVGLLMSVYKERK